MTVESARSKARSLPHSGLFPNEIEALSNSAYDAMRALLEKRDELQARLKRIVEYAGKAPESDLSIEAEETIQDIAKGSGESD